jgi:competence protein ComEC
MLHPLETDYTRGLKPNANSCVLRLQSASGQVALLVGDIEALQEKELLQRQAPLQATWLLVPHHGSATSSTAAFLDAVQPSIALVQAGYRNRYGHPRADVMARYADRQALVVQTTRCGASTWQSNRPIMVHCARDQQQRYWHHRLP